jgi:hypothetical protein
MESTLYIGGKAINVSAKLKALMLYKRQFGEEYLDRYVQIQKAEGDTKKLAEDVTITAFRIIWAMAKAYDESIPPPDLWLAGFENTDGFLQAVFKAQGLIAASAGAKKEKESGEEEEKVRITTESYLAAAVRAGIGYDAALEMTIGELNALFEAMIALSESKETAKAATQADFDSFKNMF